MSQIMHCSCRHQLMYLFVTQLNKSKKKREITHLIYHVCVVHTIFNLIKCYTIWKEWYMRVCRWIYTIINVLYILCAMCIHTKLNKIPFKKLWMIISFIFNGILGLFNTTFSLLWYLILCLNIFVKIFMKRRKKEKRKKMNQRTERFLFINDTSHVMIES